MLQLRPYVDPNDNLLAILSQFLMVIGLFITLMITIDDKQYNSDGMGLLLFLVMIFPIMYLIIGAIRNFYHTRRFKRSLSSQLQASDEGIEMGSIEIGSINPEHANSVDSSKLSSNPMYTQ